MDTLVEIVKTVLVIIIIASLLELFLPESNLKPFVSFTVGLFVLIAILNPVMNGLFRDRDFEINFWDYKYDQDLEAEMLDRGLNINQQVMDNKQEELQAKLQGQVSAITSLVPGVKEVEARIKNADSGEAQQMILVVRAENETPEAGSQEITAFGDGGEGNELTREKQEQIKNKILMLVDNLYGMKAEQIEIIFEGGED